MAAREGLRPLSGIICETVISVGQGYFTFVWKKSGKVMATVINGLGFHIYNQSQRILHELV